MSSRKIFILIIACLAVLLAVFLKSETSSLKYVQPLQQSDITKVTHVQIGDTTVTVDLALTKPVRDQGLSGRPSLAEDAGMLFVFQTPGVYPFWMPNMNFPIDIIWLDQNMHVIYIKPDAEPSSYPAAFGPNQNATYVLEVVSGFAEKHNVKVGDTVEFLQ